MGGPQEPAGDRPLPTTTWAACFFCVAAGWLVGYGVLFPPLARFTSSAPRLCHLGFIFLCYGELRGEIREGSTQAVELGTFFFFYFFFFFSFTFFFRRQVKYSAEYCRRSETRNSTRESEERAGQREESSTRRKEVLVCIPSQEWIYKEAS